MQQYIILIVAGLALLWSLLSATYFKRRLIPILGLVGMLTITYFFVLTSMEFGWNTWITDWGAYVILAGFVANSLWMPLFLLLYVHKNVWTPLHLMMPLLAYTLFTLLIFVIDLWSNEFRLGFGMTTFAFAIFGVLMAVRDEFSKLWCWLTPVLSALIAYLPHIFSSFLARGFKIGHGTTCRFILVEMLIYIALSWVVTAAAKILKQKKNA